jgi:GH24 family phage-related lysozyme (muramidase)
MTEAQLAQLVINLRQFEGAVPWLYLDSAAIPNVTVGVGVMLPHVGDAVALPFQNVSAQRGATENEVAQALAPGRAIRGGAKATY